MEDYYKVNFPAITQSVEVASVQNDLSTPSPQCRSGRLRRSSPSRPRELVTGEHPQVCSLLAQLPNLSVHSESFKVTALCDVSKQSLELCSKRFHVPNTFTSM